MTRIESSSVQLGDSYVYGQSRKLCDQELYKKENEQKKKIIDEGKSEAQSIISGAQNEAARIREEARVQAEQIREEATSQGFEIGQKQGYDQGYIQAVDQAKADLREQLEKTEVLAESAFEVKRNILKSAEKEIVELVILIAEKIIRKKIELDPEIILNITKAAINELKEKEEVKLTVNPSLTACLEDFSEEIKAAVNGLNVIKFAEDKTMKPNGLIVESVDTRIDARLETQIELIANQLILESVSNPQMAELTVEIDEQIAKTVAKKKGKGKVDD